MFLLSGVSYYAAKSSVGIDTARHGELHMLAQLVRAIDY